MWSNHYKSTTLHCRGVHKGTSVHRDQINKDFQPNLKRGSKTAQDLRIQLAN